MSLRIRNRARGDLAAPRLSGLILLIGCWTSPTLAGVTAFKSELVDNTPGGAALAGFVVNDIKLDFTGQFTGAQALIGPFAASSIYQDAAGAATPPSAAFVNVIPSLAFDTFVAMGSPTANGPWGDPDTTPGCAQDLGGCVLPAVIDGERINVSWIPGGGNVINDQTSFLIMRLTLRNNLNGVGNFLAAAGGAPTIAQASISNGVVSFVPEPASGAFVALALAVGAGFARDVRWGPGRSRQSSGDVCHRFSPERNNL